MIFKELIKKRTSIAAHFIYRSILFSNLLFLTLHFFLHFLSFYFSLSSLFLLFLYYFLKFKNHLFQNEAVLFIHFSPQYQELNFTNSFKKTKTKDSDDNILFYYMYSSILSRLIFFIFFLFIQFL